MGIGITLLTLLGVGLLVSVFNDDDDDTSKDAEKSDDERFDGSDTNDSVDAGAGNDTVFGGGGNDALLGGSGGDAIFSGAGDDLAFGEAGGDALSGGSGDDEIFGGAGNDTMMGGAGDDFIIGADIIDGPGLFRTAQDLERDLTDEEIEAFVDLTADPGEADTLDGGDGNDILLAGSSDLVTSGDGSDEIVIGEWVDPSEPVTITDFDTANDVIEYQFNETFPSTAGFVESDDGTPGFSVNGDIVALLPGVSLGALLQDGQFNLLRLETIGDEGEVLLGTGGPDSIAGGPGNDIVDAGPGNDTISASGGDDSVLGGDGDDIVQGQGGDDLIFGNTGSDFLQGRGNTDTIMGGDDGDWVNGNDGNDEVAGEGGQDTVVGGAGEDTVRGGAGADQIFGGSVVGDPLTTSQAEALQDGSRSLAEVLGVAPGTGLTIEDDNEVDLLDGRAGNDALTFGAGDIATGGAGEDDFIIIADSAGNSAGESTITDFDEEDDSLVVMRAVGSSPVNITISEAGSDVNIFVDGVLTTVVQGGAGQIFQTDIIQIEGYNVDLLESRA
ncbi:calcium-binding protein [uncultured Tateyamaria sp.]|uniref:calcium-binding protein n=1 Tax=uncultured Tateyamaria sp. TaxID=455651 RepID=UPI00260CF15B|nr:calcium-binding protein [uncultured Tateyamaria sp.]